MTIRNLLSCYSPAAPVRMIVYDREYNTKELKVCFDPGEAFAWIYEDDMEELDKIADCRITNWYVYIDYLRIHIDCVF